MGVLRALVALAACGSAAAVSKERPVAKVVRLLQDMGEQLQKDLADDKAVHEQLDCWCKTNDREKTAAIEAGTAKQSELESFLGEAAAKMDELKTKQGSTLDEVNQDEAALQEASALRMKDTKAFHAEEMNLIEAVKACDQALVVLGKHNVGLVQVRSVAQLLQRAQVLQLGRRNTPASDLLALRHFFREAQGASSFLAIPGYQSAAPQSGQIFGVLSQMKEDFAKDLADAQAKDKKDAEAYANLQTAKKEEIAAGRKLQADLDQQIAELKEKHAQSFQELEDTKKQLELDKTFLAKLEEKCSVTDTEFDQRVKDRMTEIAAVDDTIKILNDDEAYASFDKAVNSFFQIKSTSSTQERLNRATSVLLRAAAATGAADLSLLATRAQLDTFAQVKEEIDKMVAELKKQQQDEIQHRDWCIEELNNNKRATEAGYDTKTALQVKIADLEKTIEYLSKEIEAAMSAVAEMQSQMKKASENREAENADYQQTVSDQRLSQMILSKALKRMKQVYAMLQAEPGAPHVQMEASKDDPGNGPARFAKYEKHAGGNRIVSMIEEVIKDSRTAEDDAIRAEQDSQVAYDNFMQDSNKAIATYGEKITNMKSSEATSKEDFSLAQSDLKAAVASLGELHDEAGTLHKSCDFITDTFEARQAARAAEMEALSEAKAILTGMK